MGAAATPVRLHQSFRAVPAIQHVAHGDLHQLHALGRDGLGVKEHVDAQVVDEITIVGSRCGRFEPALRMLEEGDIDYIAGVLADLDPVAHLQRLLVDVNLLFKLDEHGLRDVAGG